MRIKYINTVIKPNIVARFTLMPIQSKQNGLYLGHTNTL